MTRPALLACLLVACSPAPMESHQVCTPGTQISCPCLGGENGLQTCADDGSGFDACHGCPTGTGGSGGGATSTSTTTVSATTSSGSGGCGANEKTCPLGCASLDSPDTGCAANTCAPCAYANASAVCAAGACALGACADGWGDCDGSPANGCETTLSTAQNCGACGHVCDVTETCDSSACAYCGLNMNDSQPATVAYGSNYFTAFRYQPGHSFWLLQFDIPGVAPSGNTCLTPTIRVFADSGGVPDSGTVQSNLLYGHSASGFYASGWHHVAINPPLHMVAGTTYWLSFSSISDNQNCFQAATGGTLVPYMRSSTLMSWTTGSFPVQQGGEAWPIFRLIPASCG